MFAFGFDDPCFSSTTLKKIETSCRWHWAPLHPGSGSKRKGLDVGSLGRFWGTVSRVKSTPGSWPKPKPSSVGGFRAFREPGQ